MELSYWESRWRKDKIGFHMPDGFPGLRKQWAGLELPENPRVLVPLCGKTEDMIYMEAKGAEVVGVEISEKAILDFFSDHRRQYEISNYAEFKIYSSQHIKLWQGDFLKYPEQKSEFNLIYDKAALVALPPGKRPSYADKLANLAGPKYKILLHHFIYPSRRCQGRHLVSAGKEIDSYFSDRFSSHLLEENEIPAGKFIPFQRRGIEKSAQRTIYFNEPRNNAFSE